MAAEPRTWHVAGLRPRDLISVISTSPNAGAPINDRLDWSPWTTHHSSDWTRPAPRTTGEKIDHACRSARITRREYAALIGVTRRSVTHWLSGGEVPRETFARRIDLLGTFIDTLEQRRPGLTHYIVSDEFAPLTRPRIVDSIREGDLARALILAEQAATPPSDYNLPVSAPSITEDSDWDQLEVSKDATSQHVGIEAASASVGTAVIGRS
jgi:transcriptional regulator with XRE-family HTH domain